LRNESRCDKFAGRYTQISEHGEREGVAPSGFAGGAGDVSPYKNRENKMLEINKDEYDLAVLGAGPGGYVAAIRGAQLGLKVAVVEKEQIGGVCLNRGCIPTKALIKNAEVVSLFRRAEEFGITVGSLKVDYAAASSRSREAVSRLTQGVEFLLKKHQVEVIQGKGVIKEAGVILIDTPSGKKEVKTKNILIATGSRVKSLPGIEIDGKGLIGSDEVLLWTSLPETLLIVGGGAVGVEFAYIFSAYGVKVTLIEAEPYLLPKEDEEVSEALKKAFLKQKIEVKTSCKIEAVKKENGAYRVELASKTKKETLPFEKILMAAGRSPNSENIGLEKTGVKVERGFIQVDSLMQTSVPGIYAIGDVAGKALLAHTAMAEAMVVVEKISGKDPSPIDYLSVPSCTYCHPQVASIGYTEKAALEKGLKFRIGKFPYKANGKAIATGETEGFVKLVIAAETEELLGAHLISADATEHIAELALAKRLESTAGEIARTIHPHPTLSEAIMEAAEDVFGKAIHIWKGK
jgi:dihydrolipoamide dehydrogenase